MLLSKIYPENEGLTVLVGPLEASVLQVLWDHQTPEGLTSREIHQLVTRFHCKRSYTTITTTLDRLLLKQLVTRKGKYTSAHTFYYQPAYPTERAFIRDQVNQLATKLAALLS
jgi:predicted transcriptional regulator